IPALAGGFSVDAASAVPAQVKKIGVSYSHDYVSLTWAKVKTKGLSGYTVFRGGKSLKSVNAKTLAYKDKKVKASTKYTYYVKAFKNVKQKRYYNTKTKKWQAAKPAAKNWKGKKTKTVIVKKYGKASSTMRVKTPAAPKKTPSKPVTTTETPEWSYKVLLSITTDSISFKLSKISADTVVKIYRGDNLIGSLKDTTASIKDSNLKAGTEYSYTFKIYYKNKLKKTDKQKYKTIKAAPSTTTTTTPTVSKTENGTSDQSGSDERENPSISAKYQFSSNKVILEWDAHKEATGFKVLRDGSVLGTFGADTNTYTDEGLSPETTYNYTIQVLEGEKEVIRLSKDITTLSAPQSQTQPASGNEQSSYARNLSGRMKPSGKSVKLTWESNAEATGFNIYRDGKKINSEVLGADVREYTDNNVDWNSSYEYRIEALDKEKDPLSVSGSVKTGTQPYVELKWTTVSGADLYIIYKNGSKVKEFTNANASNGEIVYKHYVDALNSSDVYKLEVKKDGKVTSSVTFK
ncbi:MAG: hypothetical protein J6D07_02120, partial [Mogibacterium sp.]|nr:hypothetical protein [Mogibacterium sp.]